VVAEYWSATGRTVPAVPVNGQRSGPAPGAATEESPTGPAHDRSGGGRHLRRAAGGPAAGGPAAGGPAAGGPAAGGPAAGGRAAGGRAGRHERRR
jgi:ATP-dependent helicase HrpB